MSTKMLRLFTLCVLLFVWTNVVVAAEKDKAVNVKCPPNMSYAKCGSACPPKCPARITPFICLAIICPTKPTCWCNTGYILKGPNHCVKPKDC